MKVLFIGARLFPELVYYAKKNGITTILTESNPDSQFLELSDKYFIVSRGMREPLEIALKEEVDAVIPLIGIDPPLKEVAWLKEELESNYGILVIGSGIKATEISVDKLITKKFLEKNHFKTPGTISPSDYNKNIEPSLVLKPREGQGGRGIEIISSKEQIEKHVQIFPDQSFLLEEFIQGLEISVEVLRWGKKSIALVPISKGHTTADAIHPIRKLRSAPADMEKLDNEKLRKISQKVVEKMGAEGTIEVEFIFDPVTEDLNILEMNTRPSGVRFLSWTSTNINPMFELVNMAQGRWNKTKVKAMMKEYASLELTVPPQLEKKLVSDHVINRFQDNQDNILQKRPWIVHGPSGAQRITIRGHDHHETRLIARKLKIME